MLQVDAGDGFFRSFPYNYQVSPTDRDRALVLAKAAARLKVDALNVGWQDLAAGPEFLLELREKSKAQGELNLISSNLYSKNTVKPLFPTETIIERNGLRIGIFGLCRPGEGLSPVLMVRDPASVAEAMVKKLRKEKQADLVIGLFNLGLAESAKLCEQVSGIDLAVVSGSPQFLWNPQLTDRTLLVQAGMGGKYLGQFDLQYYPGKRPKNQDKELKRLKEELKRVSARIGVAEAQMKDNPGLRAQYNDLVNEKAGIEQRLKAMHSLPFDYKFALVPMDAILPVDNEIAGWVQQVLDAQFNPKPAKP
jgi:2',3'-cyclic-nucleotide 2'-phosphodiesterase (5'-nucleotidase family)